MSLARLLALVLCLSALGLAACGSEEDENPPPPEPAATQERTETTAKAPDLKDTSQKPVIEKPTGAPPTKLVSEDIVKGTGKAAKKGDNLTMQYVGVSFSTGEEFDASWDAGQPFQFPLGEGMVIKGWDEGIVGMRKGGRRKLTIPPNLAYGAQGSPPAIGPNETLVFVVDVVDIK